MVNNTLSAVVPAKAGTHTPQRSAMARLMKQHHAVLMGPRLRGDDSDRVSRSPDGAQRHPGENGVRVDFLQFCTPEKMGSESIFFCSVLLHSNIALAENGL